jgi:phosphoenolpyruvate synthase/pyruvate phosphate dikinase
MIRIATAIGCRSLVDAVLIADSSFVMTSIDPSSFRRKLIVVDAANVDVLVAFGDVA